MVKQYVGARYVPKFASPVEWAADTSYEALTIVSFNNASYTSKVQVPPTVGNPASNPKYWALTGNYNAQVEQYRQETEDARNLIAQEITDRSKLIKTDENNNTVIETPNKLIEHAQNKEVNVTNSAETYNGDKTEKVTGLLTKILEGFKFIHSGGTITNKQRQNDAVIDFPDSPAGPLVNFGSKCDFSRFSSALKYAVVNFIGTWTSGTIGVTAHSNDGSCSQLVFSKTRSTENADIPVAISPKDDLGEIRFAGATNTDFKDGGWITGRVPADAVINEDITKIPTQFGFGVCDSHSERCVCLMRPFETDFTDKTGFGMDSLEGGGEIEKTPDGFYSAFFKRPICMGYPGEILYNVRWLNDGYYSIEAGSCFRIVQTSGDLFIMSNIASKPNEKIPFELEQTTAAFSVLGPVKLPRLNNADGSYVITSDSDGTLHRTSINRLRELLNGV